MSLYIKIESYDFFFHKTIFFLNSNSGGVTSQQKEIRQKV